MPIPLLDDDKIARMVALSLKAAGVEVPADMIPLLKLFVEEASLVMQEETGYDADQHAAGMGSLAKKQYSIWQFLAIAPDTKQQSDKARIEFETLKNRWVVEAARQANSYETIAGRVIRDLARSGVFIHSDEISNVEAALTEGRIELETRTGYDPKALAVQLAEHALYFYAIWKLLSIGAAHAHEASVAFGQWLSAADAWAKAAARERYKNYFADPDNRLRMQHFMPVRSTDSSSGYITPEERTGSSSSEIIFSKPPVLEDLVFTTTLDVAVACDILASAVDPEGMLDATSVEILSDVTNGATSVNATTGVVTYTPSAGYIGEDEFTYRVWDQHGKPATATITLRVTAS